MASLRALTGITTCLAALLAGPSAAHACSPDICSTVPAWADAIAPVNAAAVASDGVLVLSATRGGSAATLDLAAALEFTVTRDGQPVPGALENTDIPGLLIWRPGEPLLADAAHEVAGKLTNDATTVDTGCAEAELPLAFQFTAVDPAEPLAAPVVTAGATAEFVESNALTDLVCCDGAYPSDGPCGGGAQWTVGACAPTKGHGYLQLHIDVATPLGPATAGQLATVIRIDGEEVYRGLGPTLDIRRDGPACVIVESIDLATGDKIAADETCVGQDLVDDLGDKQLDPDVKLADKCTSPLYTCELSEEFPAAWDETKCTDLDPAGETEGETEGEPTTSASDSSGDSDSSGPDENTDEKGCGCTSTAADPSALLGLLALAGITRRRRR